MGLEEKVKENGIRNRVGIASLLCSNKHEQILETWETGIGFIVLKTMMDSDDKPNEQLHRQPPHKTDENMTIYHTGTTCKEQYNFEDDNEAIVNLINMLYNEGVAIIPSIGTKKLGERPWEAMESCLAKTPARVIELNLRYLYRELILKHAEIFKQNDREIYSDEYGTTHPNRELRMNGKQLNYAKYHANIEFESTLGNIREIFPPGNYALIVKLWPGSELKTHLLYVAENSFDAVTLINSIKRDPPEPFTGLKETKLPQMSGYALRPYRDDALRLAREMRYELPIFASGGMGIEAVRLPPGWDGKSPIDEKTLQKNIKEGAMDLNRCFESGASYVELGSVAYIRGPLPIYDTIRSLLKELGLANQTKTYK